MTSFAGTKIELMAEDGHRLGAYRSNPQSAARGGIVVVQEFFGVNDYVLNVCDEFAAEGYTAIAPVLYHRVLDNHGYGPTVPYGRENRPKGYAMMDAVGWDNAVRDVAAATKLLKSDKGRVAVVGFCWGGTLAWLAACRSAINCAVGYYPVRLSSFIDNVPKAPVMMHFGEHDEVASIDDAHRLRDANPSVTVHIYPSNHGFASDRAEFRDEANAALARDRTLAFLQEHVGRT